MTQRNVSKATVLDPTVWLLKRACVIGAVRLSKALKRCALKGAKQCARPCCPLLKLPLIKKSIILTPCTSTKLENEQRKSYWILILSCWTTDILLFYFYRIWGHGPDQSHYNQSRLGLDQWSSTFFVKSPPSRHFAWKSTPSYNFSENSIFFRK